MKRRFGISIPDELAVELDEFVRITGSDRSSVVCEAIKQYVYEHRHYEVEHNCSGLLICVRKESRKKKSINIDEFRDVVKNYVHFHLDNMCIEIFVVAGLSNRISKLHYLLREATPYVRYYSLHEYLYG